MLIRPLSSVEPAHRGARRAPVLRRLVVTAACAVLGAGPTVSAVPATAAPAAAPDPSGTVAVAAPAPSAEPTAPSEGTGEQAAGTEDEAALAESARQWYIDSYVERMGEAWSAGEVFTDSATAAFWDERQRGIVDDALAEVEADVSPVYIGLLNRFPSRDRTGEHVSGDTSERMLEEILLADAEARAIETGYYVLWNSDAELYTMGFSEGVLTRSLTKERVPELNAEVPGPAIHYAIRTGLDHAEDPAANDIERLTSAAQDVRPEHAAVDRVPLFPVFHTIVLIGVGGLLGAGYLVLGGMIRSGAEVLGSLLFGRREKRRARAAADSVEQLRDLNRMRDRAIGARLSLRRREPLPGDLGAAVDRLPAPGDTTNPLVWTAWTVLDDEARGRRRERCFFLPHLQADEKRTWDGFGGDIEVPVSTVIAQELAAGEAPDFLSDRGIAQGRPYWQDEDSPFALSGFGAFGPLSTALASASEGWEPSPGLFESPSEFEAALSAADEQDRARKGRRTGGRKTAPRSAPVRPWLPAWIHITAVSLVIPVLVTGLGCLYEQNRRAGIASVASPAHLPLVALEGEVDTTRVDAAARAVEEDGVYIDPTQRLGYAPEDEERFARLVAEAEDPVAVVVIDFESTDAYRGGSTGFELALHDRIPEDTTLVIASSGFVQLSRYEAIPRYDGGEAELRERTADLPVRDVVKEYITALPGIGWSETRDPETEHRNFYDYQAEEYEPGPFPGTPEYFDRVRTSVISSGAVALVLLIIGGLVFGRAYLDNTRRK